MAKKTEKKEVTKSVNVVKIATPKNLTLTGLPANEVGFRIVRKEGDNKGEGVKGPRIVRQRQVRRMAPTLLFSFPTEMTEEEIAVHMKEYGIDEYKVEKKQDGWIVMRNDLTEMPESYIVTHLKDGIKALIVKGEVKASDAEPMPHITVAAIEFDRKTFDTPEKVADWLSQKSVDFSETSLDNTREETVVLTRHEVADKVETKRCRVDDGVEVVVVKSAEADVPPSMVEVVSEVAYGSWGWGQLDFAAYMADVEFCELSRRGLEVLESVVYQILYWSQLPIAVRKELLTRAMAQFAEFINGLLDALPTKVLISYRSEQETATMTTKQEGSKTGTEPTAEQKKRADDVAKAREALKGKLPEAELAKKTDDEVLALATAEKAKEDEANKPVTRAEVKELINSGIKETVPTAITEALRGIFAPPAKEAQRTDNPEATAAVELGKQMATAIRAELEPVTKATTDLTKNVGDLTKTVEGLGERLKAVEGETTARSDNGDGAQAKDKKPADVFRGIFGRREQAAS